MYYIWCRVEGGVTGKRENYLHENDKRVTFKTKEEAQREADRLNKTMNTGYGPARFTYRVV